MAGSKLKEIVEWRINRYGHLLTLAQFIMTKKEASRTESKYADHFLNLMFFRVLLKLQ